MVVCPLGGYPLLELCQQGFNFFWFGFGLYIAINDYTPVGIIVDILEQLYRHLAM